MRSFLEELDLDFAKDNNSKLYGVKTQFEQDQNIEIVYAKLSKKNSLGRDGGEYLTYNIDFLDENTSQNLVKKISDGLIKLSGAKFSSILIVGIGNPLLISDSLGPKCLDKISIDIVDKIKIYKLSPDVSQNCGIASFVKIKAIVDCLNPDLVVVIDSLCATNYSRIGNSFQLTNAGINPGSGVGESECILNAKTLNRKVIAIGVPTAIYFASCLKNILDKKSSRNLLRTKNDMLSLILSPKDVDVVVENCSDIISSAITMAVKTI